MQRYELPPNAEPLSLDYTQINIRRHGMVGGHRHEWEGSRSVRLTAETSLFLATEVVVLERCQTEYTG